MLLLIFILITINLSIIYFNFQKIKLYFLNLSNLEKILFVLSLILFNFFFFIIIYYFLFSNKTNKLLKVNAEELNNNNNEKFNFKLTKEGKNYNSEQEFREFLNMIVLLSDLVRDFYMMYSNDENLKKFFNLLNKNQTEKDEFLENFDDNKLNNLTIENLYNLFLQKMKWSSLLQELVESESQEDKKIAYTKNKKRQIITELQDKLFNLEIEFLKLNNNNLEELNRFYNYISDQTGNDFDIIIKQYLLEDFLTLEIELDELFKIKIEAYLIFLEILNYNNHLRNAINSKQILINYNN